MNAREFQQQQQFVETDYGRIAYVEAGEGPAALFVHGALLSGYQWRHQLTGLSDCRRIIVPDSLGMGATQARHGLQLGMKTQAEMLAQFMGALNIERFDVIGNDSGGGTAQILAANNPACIRTLCLTNCEVQDHDEEPPIRLAFRQSLRDRSIVKVMQTLIDHPGGARHAFSGVYQYPDNLPMDIFEAYFAPLIQSEERIEQMINYVFATTKQDHLDIEDKIKAIAAPTLVLWGLADTFFPVQWAHWLKDNLANVVELQELVDAPLFWPEERPDFLNAKLREFWQHYG